MTEEKFEVQDIPEALEEAPKEKKNKTLWIILIVVAVLLLLCCCVVAIVAFFGFQEGGFLEDAFGLMSPMLALI